MSTRRGSGGCGAPPSSKSERGIHSRESERHAERVYRLLLLAYPPGFRRQHGEEMARAFRDLCRDETARHRRSGALRALAPSALDLLRTAPAAWLDTLRGPDLRYAARGLRQQPGFSLATSRTATGGASASS